MPSFGGGLAHALTAGVTGYGQGEEENRRALIVLAAQRRAEERAKQQDAFTREKLDAERTQQRRENLMNGLVEGETKVTRATTPGTGASPLTRSFDEALNQGNAAPETSSLRRPVDLGSIPKYDVTVTEDRFDPMAGKQGALQQERLAEQAAGREDAQASRVELERMRMQDRQEGRQQNADLRREIAKQGKAGGAAGVTTAQNLRLSTMFDNDPIIKNAKELTQAVGKIRASVSDPSAAGDLSLLYGYNKLLDPGSVVRESEFANVQNSGSVDQRIRAAWLKVVKGQRLTPEQRTDFLKRADQLARSQQTLVLETVRRHAARAKTLGADPSTIVYDPFEETMGATPGPTNAPPGNLDLSNAALTSGKPQGATEDQRLWDAAVAKHGKDRVLKEYGARP